MDMSKYAKEWVNPENISADATKPTIAKITSAGEQQEDEQYGKSVAFTVEIEGREFSYRPNKTSIRIIGKKLGSMDSAIWVGKEIGLYSIQQIVNGKTKKAIFAVSQYLKHFLSRFFGGFI